MTIQSTYVCPSDQGELLPGTCNVNVSSAETLDIRNTVLSVIIEKEDSERTVQHTPCLNLHVTTHIDKSRTETLVLS